MTITQSNTYWDVHVFIVYRFFSGNMTMSISIVKKVGCDLSNKKEGCEMKWQAYYDFYLVFPEQFILHIK